MYPLKGVDKDVVWSMLGLWLPKQLPWATYPCIFLWVFALVANFIAVFNYKADSDPDQQNTFNLWTSLSLFGILLQIFTILFIFTHWTPFDKSDLKLFEA